MTLSIGIIIEEKDSKERKGLTQNCHTRENGRPRKRYPESFAKHWIPHQVRNDKREKILFLRKS